ncbi:hypothetical protein [Actinoplanes teichomyceticus]|uniref:Uncharacterized protein n=1 Tax=Actinoplanes teichomyceticus TaxID=1867 RepID=A0A561WIJ6_ACTTI|nr:hypothetical protein [Actinoplanes teichomyceticus]TWG23709.1 hypothetical protein FHX34_102260 [Actinoplanes teichomyceticus]GIF11749.1 hypothetical protein Ate01nite_17810 [Actinoplanes teichomyceticus]
MGDRTDAYDRTTYRSTDQPWPGDAAPVDVDLDGLREYARLIAARGVELAEDLPHLTPLTDAPHRAWQGRVLGEAAAVRQQLLNNASELFAYLGALGRTLHNIGAAAQTIADIYRDGDATSAASLDDVRFAFGDRSVARPDGLPATIGRTYQEAPAVPDGDGPPGTLTPGQDRPAPEGAPAPTGTVASAYDPFAGKGQG